MSLYYFHLRDGADVLLDPEGRELDGGDAIADAALLEARGILSDDAQKGQLMLDQVIDVEDSAGRIVHRLQFADAIAISWPVAGGQPAAVAANISFGPTARS